MICAQRRRSAGWWWRALTIVNGRSAARLHTNLAIIFATEGNTDAAVYDPAQPCKELGLFLERLQTSIHGT